MLKGLKQKVINFVLKGVFKAVVPEDIVTFSREGRILLNNEQLAEQEIRSIQEEIKYFERSRLYGILINTKSLIAQERMMSKSTSWDDVFFGKACLYDIDVDKKIMERFKKHVIRK